MPRIDINGVYMKIAQEIAQLSYSNRDRVGAIIVKNDSIISYGYNGMPYGFDNICEIDNVTKKETLHAESNAIAKVAKSFNSTNKASLYITLSPCFECSKLIVQSGIKEVWYLNTYRDESGLSLLTEAGIKINHIKL